MQKLIWYAASLMFVTLGACQSVTSETSMPIKNAGFEGVVVNQILSGWDYEEHAGQWRGHAYEVSTDAGPGTGRALRVAQLHTEIYSFVHQKIRVRPEDAGKRIRFSAMLKTDQVGPIGWKLAVNMVKGGDILDQFLSTPVSGTTTWRQAAVTGTIPLGTTDIDIGFLHMDSGVGWAADPLLVIE